MAQRKEPEAQAHYKQCAERGIGRRIIAKMLEGTATVGAIKQSTAIDGSVLAAVRWLARQILGGISADFSRYGVFESEKAFECAQGNLQSDKGIGRDLIERVLTNMPGMTRNSIGESLGRLKSSGDYARTLTAITQQIEAEVEAARPFPSFPPVPMGVRQRWKLYKSFIP